MGLVHHPNIVSDGLIGCWDAANKRSYPGAGSTLIDLAGSNSATLNYDTEFVDFNGGAIYLDGSDDNVTVPIIDGQNGFSFSIWLYFRVVPTDQYTTFSIYNGGGAEFMLYIMEVSRHATSYMFGIRGAGTGNTLTSTNTAYQPSSNLDKWVHYCATYNGGGATTVGNYKVYFNGQVTDTNLISDFGGAGNQDPMKWGQDAAGAGDLDGYMGHIAFYNRALSADEVSQNYEAMKPRFEPRITKRGMNLNFDAGDPASYPGGTSWKDTANGLSTTFHNMSASNFNSSNGGYFDFDGTNEWMTAPHSPLFQSAIADQGTFAAWFNIDAAEADNADVPIWCGGRNGSRLVWSMAQYNSSKKMHLGAYIGGWGAHGDTATALSYDTWYYVVYTWDKANTEIKSYINGASSSTETTSSTSISTSSTGWLGIGASLYGLANSSTPNDYLNGFIGVLQLYDSVLSAAEILENYNKTKARFGH